MRVKVIKPEKFGWKGVVGWGSKMGTKASLSHIKISVPISKRRSLRCDRIYYIIADTATFSFGTNKVKVKKNEAIRIPKMTTYSYKPLTTIELVEINVPYYNSKYEEVDL